MNDAQICKEVEKFLKPIPEKLQFSRKVQKRNREVEEKYEIDSRYYIRTLMQIMLSNHPTQESFATVFLKLIGVHAQQDCSLGMDYSIDPPDLMLAKDAVVFHTGDPTELETLVITASELVKLTESCVFSFVELGITKIHSGHQNIIFLYRSGSHITVCLYEPHESQRIDEPNNHISEISDFIGQVCAVMSAKFSVEVDFLSPIEISCPIGLQSAAREFDIGYCIAFSYFWLYMVFKTVHDFKINPDIPASISESFKNQDDVELILRYIEYGILNCDKVKNEPKKLMNIIQNFAIWMYNSYIEYIALKNPKQFQEVMSYMENTFHIGFDRLQKQIRKIQK